MSWGELRTLIDRRDILAQAAREHEAGFRARRLVVERTHAWLNRLRRILAV